MDKDSKDLIDLQDKLVQVVESTGPIIDMLISIAKDKEHIAYDIAEQHGYNIFCVAKALGDIVRDVRCRKALMKDHKELENWRSLSVDERKALLEKSK